MERSRLESIKQTAGLRPGWKATRLTQMMQELAELGQGALPGVLLDLQSWSRQLLGPSTKTRYSLTLVRGTFTEPTRPISDFFVPLSVPFPSFSTFLVFPGVCS